MAPPPKRFRLRLLPMAGLAKGLAIARLIRPAFRLGNNVIHLGRTNETPLYPAQTAEPFILCQGLFAHPFPLATVSALMSRPARTITEATDVTIPLMLRTEAGPINIKGRTSSVTTRLRRR